MLIKLDYQSIASMQKSSEDNYTLLLFADGARRVWCSQPAGAGGAPDAPDLSAADMDALLCYSQPAHADEALPASPQDACTPLVRRATRVWLRCDDAAALRALAAALAGARCAWRRVHPRIFAIECADEVRMRAWALPAGGAGGVGGEGGEAQSVVEFRRSRGCGLAFKRRYLQLRRALLELAPGAEPPPRAHALAAPLHALAPAAEPMDC